MTTLIINCQIVNQLFFYKYWERVFGGDLERLAMVIFSTYILLQYHSIA